MKKFIAILMVICLIVSVFSINAFAADERPESAEGTIITNAPNATPHRFASIFGEGSFSMVVSLLALAASGTAIFMAVVNHKKIADLESANSTEEADEE